MAHIQIILIEKIMVTSGWGGFYLIVFFRQTYMEE